MSWSGIPGPVGTPGFSAESKLQIKEAQRLPIKIIKTAMRQAGYKVGIDFIIDPQEYSEAIHVTSKPGRRVTWLGACQIHGNRKGKMNVFWVPTRPDGSKHSNDVDIILAEPDSFKKLMDIIITATKECRLTAPLNDTITWHSKVII